jgi:hypothetical protein
MAGPAPGTISAQERAAVRSARSLRNLYLFRTGFSMFWVALVFSLTSIRAEQTTVGLLGGMLLVIYPVSDAIATLFDLRSGPIVARWPQRLNLAADLAAAPAVLVALQSSLADAITVLGHRHRRSDDRLGGAPAAGAERTVAHDRQWCRLGVRRDNVRELDRVVVSRPGRASPVFGGRGGLVPADRGMAVVGSPLSARTAARTSPVRLPPQGIGGHRDQQDGEFVVRLGVGQLEAGRVRGMARPALGVAGASVPPGGGVGRTRAPGRRQSRRRSRRQPAHS